MADNAMEHREPSVELKDASNEKSPKVSPRSGSSSASASNPDLLSPSISKDSFTSTSSPTKVEETSWKDSHVDEPTIGEKEKEPSTPNSNAGNIDDKPPLPINANCILDKPEERLSERSPLVQKDNDENRERNEPIPMDDMAGVFHDFSKNDSDENMFGRVRRFAYTWKRPLLAGAVVLTITGVSVGYVLWGKSDFTRNIVSKEIGRMSRLY